VERLSITDEVRSISRACDLPFFRAFPVCHRAQTIAGGVPSIAEGSNLIMVDDAKVLR
jgi:hypothetical protein